MSTLTQIIIENGTSPSTTPAVSAASYILGGLLIFAIPFIAVTADSGGDKIPKKMLLTMSIIAVIFIMFGAFWEDYS